MGKTHIKMDEYLAERLGPRKPTVSSRPQERKDDGADSMERGGGKAEDVPVPTDADDEDMTLGEIFTKRKRARHDAPGATRPRGTQKRARRERGRDLVDMILIFFPAFPLCVSLLGAHLTVTVELPREN